MLADAIRSSMQMRQFDPNPQIPARSDGWPTNGWRIVGSA
jgi:hypothetical protein